VKEKYPNGKRVEQDGWHARPREARVYTPKKWESPGSVIVNTKNRYTPYSNDAESYDTGGFILDSVAFSTRGASDTSGFSTGGYRGAHLDVDQYGVTTTPTRKKTSPAARPKTTEYDQHGRPKGEPIFDPDSILTNRS
jgi:hypothetical protein